ncbi:MAG: hypothetical protein R3292_12610 [Alcanivorax sp.]|nr:hypothetical protein [Alcanivorax sp.]
MKTTIPCPNCQCAIHLETDALLAGTRFSCSGCDAAVSLTNTSKPVVSNAMQEFEKLMKAQGKSTQ